MSAHGIRTRLRDQYTCARELGGCGAVPGSSCLSAAGNPTQPHAARWNAYWRELGRDPVAEHLIGSAPRGTPDQDLSLAYRQLERAQGLLSTATQLVNEALAVVGKRVTGDG